MAENPQPISEDQFCQQMGGPLNLPQVINGYDVINDVLTGKNLLDGEEIPTPLRTVSNPLEFILALSRFESLRGLNIGVHNLWQKVCGMNFSVEQIGKALGWGFFDFGYEGDGTFKFDVQYGQFIPWVEKWDIEQLAENLHLVGENIRISWNDLTAENLEVLKQFAVYMYECKILEITPKFGLLYPEQRMSFPDGEFPNPKSESFDSFPTDYSKMSTLEMFYIFYATRVEYVAFKEQAPFRTGRLVL